MSDKPLLKLTKIADKVRTFRATRQFSRIRKIILKQGRARFKGFEQLDYLQNAQNSKTMLTATKRAISYYWRANLIEYNIRRRIQWSALTFVPISSLSTIIYAWYSLSQEYRDSGMIHKGNSPIVITLILAFAITTIASFIPPPKQTAIIIAGLLVTMIVPLTFAMLSSRAPLDYFAKPEEASIEESGIYFAFWITVTFLMSAAFSTALVILRERIILNRCTGRFPRSIIIAHLTLVVLRLPQPGNEWRTYVRRHECLHLSKASFAFKRGMPRIISRLNLTPREMLTVSQRMEGAAIEIDSYRLWFALPKADTYQIARANLSELITILLQGNLDALPLPTQLNTINQSRRQLAFRFARVLLAAFIPATVLFGFRKIGLTLPETLQGAATLACAAWAIVTLLLALDPLLRDKISITSDLFSLFRGNKKE